MSEVLSSNRLITQIYQALNWILQSCWALCYWYPYKALYTTLFTVKGHNKQYQLYRLIDKLLRWPTINIFCRLLGNIVIKIYVENTCSAVDYLARPTKLLWGTGGTDGDTAFGFIDVIREWEGKSCTGTAQMWEMMCCTKYSWRSFDLASQRVYLHVNCWKQTDHVYNLYFSTNDFFFVCFQSGFPVFVNNSFYSKVGKSLSKR